MEDNNYTPEVLSRLPREELRRILTEELHKPTAEIDDVLVRKLMAELHSRGTNPSYSDDTTVEQACAKFRKNTQKAQPHRKLWYQSWMLKVASIVLVLGILFFSLPGAAQADDIHEVLSWWSDSTFRFFNPSKQPNVHVYVYDTDHPGLQQIYETVTELGITDPIVPCWVPDGFELIELETFSMSQSHSVYANLRNNEKTILLTMTIQDSNMVLQHEKDKNTVTIWDLAGKEHYVISNKNEQIVTWVTNGVECTINSDCSEEDVYRIVKSIYTSED